MTVLVPSSPTGHTIFCDDFRQEINGKFIFIGVYVGDMIFFGHPPGLLPTFCAVVTYLERPGESNDPVTFKLFAPGSIDPIYAGDVQVDILRSSPPPPEPIGEVNPDFRQKILVPIKLSPVMVGGDGLFKVRAYRGDEEIRLGTLRTIFQPLSSLPQPPT